jgi:DNA-binding IclR family transcriptional regulator
MSDSQPEPASDGAVKSADRALAILDLVGQRGSLKFAELISALGLPRSSAHGLVQTLLARGWLEQRTAGRELSLGLRVWELGQHYAGHHDLLTAARPVMDALALEVGETVQLARLDGLENVYIAISDSPQPMRLSSTVGLRLPSHATGIGKALLSQLDPDEVGRRLEGAHLETFTAHTVSDPEELVSEIERVRIEGYAEDNEEYQLGCRCVAVPLRSPTLTAATPMVTALSITAPLFRCGPDWPEKQLTGLRRAVEALGGSTADDPRTHMNP